MGRPATLSDFLACTQAAIAARVAPDTAPARAMCRVAAALSSPAPQRSSPAPRLLPVCELLPAALATLEQRAPDLSPVAAALRELALQLMWRQRSNDDPVFMQSHANTALVGPEPDALEQRSDVRVGISLVAPGVTYPDHRHPPEEVYIVLSEGDWRQESGPWHTPGIGGIVYNPHNIVHAMRSGSDPLLAIWCLPVEAQKA